MRDKKLAEAMSRKPCLVCSSTNSVVGHHILSFGSRPDLDNEQNVMPLCYMHHAEVHNIGLTSFVKKHSLSNEMTSRGFFFELKWRLLNVE